MKNLDIILIVLGAVVCLFLLFSFRRRKIGPYWLTYVIPTLLGVLIIAAVIINAVRGNPPSQNQMWKRMEKAGCAPVDVTQQEKANLPYINSNLHAAISAGEDFAITWYQFSYESDGRQQISKLLEELRAADSGYQAEYFHGRYTTRCTITNGDDYYLLILYDDTLLSIHGTMHFEDAIQAAADDLGYWE